jgi:hypothetical protein
MNSEISTLPTVIISKKGMMHFISKVSTHLARKSSFGNPIISIHNRNGPQLLPPHFLTIHFDF